MCDKRRNSLCGSLLLLGKTRNIILIFYGPPHSHTPKKNREDNSLSQERGVDTHKGGFYFFLFGESEPCPAHKGFLLAPFICINLQEVLV